MGTLRVVVPSGAKCKFCLKKNLVLLMVPNDHTREPGGVAIRSNLQDFRGAVTKVEAY